MLYSYILSILLLVVALLVQYSSCVDDEFCPSKVVPGDRFKTQERFDALKEKIYGKEFKVQHQHKTEGRGQKVGDEYEYVFSLCGKNGKAAITQRDVTDTNKDPINVALFDNSSMVFGGADWLMLEYHNGHPYTTKHHCNGARREAMIYVRCEKEGKSPQLILIEEARFNSHPKAADETFDKTQESRNCYYLFELNHPAVCSVNKNLSGGAIFVIIVFSLAAAYLLFGFLYQRFIVGAKGWDQIPNFPFWKKVGNASADGCDFVCRREERASTYKGMADALDIDSSDDDKDDGLLPM